MSHREGILVIGAPRSGTTLLRRILDAHPDIACPPETTLFSAAARFLHEQPLDNGVRFGVLEGLGQAGFTEEQVLERLRSFVFGFHRDHATARGKPRWAEKTAADVFHLEGIRKLAGQHVHYICVVRHGLDAAVSMADLALKSGGYLDEIHPFVAAEHRPMVAFANAWATATTQVLDLVDEHPEQATLLRYEDLIADPVAALEPVFAAIDAPFTPQLLADALKLQGAGFGDWKTWSRDAIDGSSIGRYRKDLSKSMRAELGTRLNPLLERAGYPPVKIPKLPKHDAKRRMELAMRINAMRKS